MKKLLLFIFTLVACQAAIGQVLQPTYVRGDTVTITNKNKASVIILQMANKDSSGRFIKNLGNGKIGFSKIQIGDIPGLSDTLGRHILTFGKNFKKLMEADSAVALNTDSSADAAGNNFLLAQGLSSGNIVKINANFNPGTNKILFNGIGVQSNVAPTTGNDYVNLTYLNGHVFNLYNHNDVLTGDRLLGGNGHNLTINIPRSSGGAFMRLDSLDGVLFQGLDRTGNYGGQIILDSLQFAMGRQLNDVNHSGYSIGSSNDQMKLIRNILPVSTSLEQGFLWGNARFNSTGVEVVDEIDSVGAKYKSDASYKYGGLDTLWMPNLGFIQRHFATIGTTGSSANSDLLNSHAGSYYLDRANHTGSQAESTITGLVSDLAAKLSSATAASTYALIDTAHYLPSYLQGDFVIHNNGHKLSIKDSLKIGTSGINYATLLPTSFAWYTSGYFLTASPNRILMGLGDTSHKALDIRSAGGDTVRQSGLPFQWSSAVKFTQPTTFGAPMIMTAQSSVTTPSSTTQLIYANSLGQFTIMGSNGYSASISKGAFTASRTFYLPDVTDTLINATRFRAATTDINTLAGNYTSGYTAIGLKQPRIILGDPGSSSTVIAAGDTVNKALWKLQNQILANGTAIAGKQATLTGPGYVKQVSGSPTYITSIPDGDIASAANWNTAYTNRITSLTNTGSSGASTLVSNVLNIPNYTLAGLGGFANPMTTAGDIMYGGTSGTPTRLGIGTNGYFVQVQSGLPAYFNLFGTANTFTANITAPTFIGSGSLAFSSGGTAATSDFSSQGTGAAAFTTAGVEIGGVQTYIRVLMNGASAGAPAAGNPGANLVIGNSAGWTLPSTGTTPSIGQLFIKTVGAITNGSSIPLTETYALKIEGSGSGGTANYGAELLGLTKTAQQVVSDNTAAVNATATITAAQLINGTITSTSASPTTGTLPTATLLAAPLAAAQGTHFFFTIDNSAGASVFTVAVGTGITTVTAVVTGSDTLTVGAGKSGRFEIYFSSGTTAVLSRLW